MKYVSMEWAACKIKEQLRDRQEHSPLENWEAIPHLPSENTMDHDNYKAL